MSENSAKEKKNKSSSSSKSKKINTNTKKNESMVKAKEKRLTKVSEKNPKKKKNTTTKKNSEKKEVKEDVITKEKVNDFVPKKKNKIAKFLLRFTEDIFYILLIGIILILLVPRFTDNKNSFLGIRVYIVATGSMVPKYNVGDVLVYKDKKPEELKEKDDLLYRDINGYIQGTKNQLITHQIIKIDKENTGELKIHTKGLANLKEDPLVSEEQVVSTVLFKSNILTFLINMLYNNKYVFYFIGIVPLTIIFFFGFLKAGYKKKI